MAVNKRWLSDLLLLGIACIWGSTFILVQDAIALLPPFSFIALRFGAAALLLALFTRALPKETPPTPATSPWHEWSYGFILGALLFLAYALQTFSLLFTTSGKAGFLTGLSVALVPLLSFLILRNRPSLPALLGVALACIGLYLLAFVDLSAINQGDILAFLCAVGFGLQLVYTGKFSVQASTQRLVIMQLATVSFLSFIAAFLFEPWQQAFQPSTLLQPTVITALVITSLFATALAFLAQTHIQRFTTPTRVALIFATEPVFAALADFLWNDVTLSPRALLGCALILGGTILTEMKIPWLQAKNTVS